MRRNLKYILLKSTQSHSNLIKASQIKYALFVNFFKTRTLARVIFHSFQKRLQAWFCVFSKSALMNDRTLKGHGEKHPSILNIYNFIDLECRIIIIKTRLFYSNSRQLNFKLFHFLCCQRTTKSF